MEEPPRGEGHNSEYVGWVDRATRAHREALRYFGRRGWTARGGVGAVLSEEEAEECLVGAFKRFMEAIDKRNHTIMKLLHDHAPESRNVYYMLRWMMKLSAYDIFRENGRYVTQGGLGESEGSETEEESAASVMETLVQAYQERHPQRDPREEFEKRTDLARIVDAAIRRGLLNETRQFILLAHLAGREDADIAAELGLEPQQVQRHMYKIREALREANRGLEGDD